MWRGIDPTPPNGTSSRTPAGPNGELRDWEAAAIGGPYMKFKWRDYAWAEEAHFRQVQKLDGSVWLDVGPQIEETRGTGMHYLVESPRVLEQDIGAGPGPSGPAPSLNTGLGTYRMCGQVAYRASEPGHVRRLGSVVTCSSAVTVNF